jgi:predicted esterase
MPDAIVCTLPVTQHGRFLLTPAPGAGPWPLLVGFHGYAENAAVMDAVLARIPGAEAWLRVSIQGLHRFYHPKRGDVIASWMTREDRDLAIADNLAYVDAVLARVESEHGPAPCLVHVGFSQGVAMTWRAALRATRRADAVVALGGDLPPDLRGHLAGAPPALLARGDADEWYTVDQFAADRDALRGAGVPVEAFSFAGGHAWNEAVLARAGEFLARVRQGRVP